MMKSIVDEETITITIPTSVSLDLTPELTILSLLKASIPLTIKALTCAHPDIASFENSHGRHRPSSLALSASACTADSIISHLNALHFGIESYHRSRTRDMSWAEEPPVEDVPF
jgi:hypothetical protein